MDFQAFHRRLAANKRLYMTATQRIYSEQSVQATRRAAEKKGLAYDIVDMADVDVYGPLLHHVKFSEAVAAGELADYRVIVLGIRESSLTPGIRAALAERNAPRKASDTDLCRLLGTMLAPATRSTSGRPNASMPETGRRRSTTTASWLRTTTNTKRCPNSLRPAT